MSSADFKILGVPLTASLAEVRAAYKAKALQYHPDRATGNAEMFKAVHKAYNSLTALLEGGGGGIGMGRKTNSASGAFFGRGDRAEGGAAESTDGLAATWSGLGTERSVPTFGGPAGRFTGAHAATSFGMPAGNSSRASTSSFPAARPQQRAASKSTTTAPTAAKTTARASFMNPTQSSKGAENPRASRHPPSTAPPKPSTLGSEHLQGSRRRAATYAQQTGPSAAAPAFLRTVGLPVEFQRADLTSIILDVSPAAFAAIGGPHLRLQARATRRSDGMGGVIAGVSPATGALYWHKEGSSYVSVAGGSVGDYAVTASTPPPAPAAAAAAPRSQAASPTKQASPADDLQSQTSFSEQQSYGPTPSASSAAPTPWTPYSNSASGGDFNDQQPKQQQQKGANNGNGGENMGVGRFVDPFAVTDSSNTVYFSSPVGRRTHTVSGVFGVLGGAARGGMSASGSVDACVVQSRTAPRSAASLHTSQAYGSSSHYPHSGTASPTGGADFRPFPNPSASAAAAAAATYVRPATSPPTPSLFAPVGSAAAPGGVDPYYVGTNVSGAVRAKQTTPPPSPSEASAPTTPRAEGGAAAHRSSLPLRFPVTAVPSVRLASALR